MINSAPYTDTAIWLHWLTVILIASGFSLGTWMVDLPLIDKVRGPWYPVHKWIGITIFLFAVARLLWRVGHPAPVLPAGTPIWQQRAATISHGLLYVLLLAIPISGYLFSSAAGVSVKYFNLIPLPDLISKDRELAQALKTVHLTLNYTLLAVVVAHIAAALKHHFIDRDDVLTRMLPAVKPKPGISP